MCRKKVNDKTFLETDKEMKTNIPPSPRIRHFQNFWKIINLQLKLVQKFKINGLNFLIINCKEHIT